MMVNDRMPEYCVERAGKILNRYKLPLNGAKVLVLGVAYKQDVDDYRESPAIRVIEELLRHGAEVMYYDPWVKSFAEGSLCMSSEPQLSADLVESADIVMITTAHTNVDYGFVRKHAKVIFDTKNAMKAVEPRDNIVVL